MLADISFGNALWLMLEFFFLFILIMILVNVLMDLFRDHELSGGMKALWCIFLLLLPWLAVFVYLIARGPGMQKRALAQQAAAQKEYASYIQETAGASPADQISKAKALLDAGTITQAEFDTMKAKALG